MLSIKLFQIRSRISLLSHFGCAALGVVCGLGHFALAKTITVEIPEYQFSECWVEAYTDCPATGDEAYDFGCFNGTRVVGLFGRTKFGSKLIRQVAAKHQDDEVDALNQLDAISQELQRQGICKTLKS